MQEEAAWTNVLRSPSPIGWCVNYACTRGSRCSMLLHPSPSCFAFSCESTRTWLPPYHLKGSGWMHMRFCRLYNKNARPHFTWGLLSSGDACIQYRYSPPERRWFSENPSRRRRWSEWKTEETKEERNQTQTRLTSQKQKQLPQIMQLRPSFISRPVNPYKMLLGAAH